MFLSIQKNPELKLHNPQTDIYFVYLWPPSITWYEEEVTKMPFCVTTERQYLVVYKWQKIAYWILYHEGMGGMWKVWK